MAKQIFNTRGKSLDQIKEILKDKIEDKKVLIQYQIDRTKKTLDDWLDIKQKNEQDIIYLEKFISRKEKK